MSCGPVGAVAGVAIGGVAGLILRLGRRRPRVAAGLTAGVLVAAAASPVQAWIAASLTDLVLFLRLEGRYWAVPTISPVELDETLGAVTGAFDGAIIAGFLIWIRQADQPARTPAPAVTATAAPLTKWPAE